MKPRREATAVRVLVTVLLCGVLLHYVPLRRGAEALASTQVVPLGLAVAADLGVRLLYFLRWHILLKSQGVLVTYLDTVRIGLIGLFYSNFLPTTIGGDLAKTYILARGKGASMTDIGASVVADRVLGLCTWLLVAAVGVLVFRVEQARSVLLGLAGMLLLGLLALLIVAARSGRGNGDVNTPDKRDQTMLGSFLKAAREFATAIIEYRNRLRSVLPALIVSFIGAGAMGLSVHYYCKALGYDLLLSASILYAAIISVVGMVPIAIAGLGLREGAFVSMLTLAGMSAPKALAASLAARIVLIGFSLVGGVLQLASRGPRPVHSVPGEARSGPHPSAVDDAKCEVALHE